MPITIDKSKQSTNFNSRLQPIQMIVIHWTSGKMPGCLEWMCTPKTTAAHYLITVDGKIYQIVDESKRAWHAGTPSSLPGFGDDINSRSIGIELEGPPSVTNKDGWLPSQIDACVELCKDINSRYQNKLVLTDHASVGKAFGKTDVRLGQGKDKFPWDEFVQKTGMKAVVV